MLIDEYTFHMIFLSCGCAQQFFVSRYEGELEKEMQGPTFQLLSKMMKVIVVSNYSHYPQRRMRAHVSIMIDTKVLVKRKITVPGSFLGHSSTPAVSCSYKVYLIVQ